MEGQVNPESSSALVKPCSPNTSLSTPTRGAARNWTTAERMDDGKFTDSAVADATVPVPVPCDLSNAANMRVGDPMIVTSHTVGDVVPRI